MIRSEIRVESYPVSLWYKGHTPRTKFQLKFHHHVVQPLAFLIARQQISVLDHAEFTGYAWSLNRRYIELMSFLALIVGIIGFVYHRLALAEFLVPRIHALDRLQVLVTIVASVFFILSRMARNSSPLNFPPLIFTYIALNFCLYFLVGRVGSIDEPWGYTLLFNSIFTAPIILPLNQRALANMSWGFSGMAGLIVGSPETLHSPFLGMFTGFVLCGMLFSTGVGAWITHYVSENYRQTWELSKAQLALREEKERALRFAEEKAHEATSALIKLDHVRDDEQKRIARDLHDELGHLIVTHNLTLQKFRLSYAESPDLGTLGETMTSELAAIESGARRVVTELRSHATHSLRLKPMVEEMLAQLTQSSGIACEYIVEPEDLEPDQELYTVLFRILQEATNNIRKHSRATKTEVSIEHQNGRLHVYIRDNGIGFIEKKSGFGLFGMDERVRMIGGEITITSAPDRGTELSIVLPLRNRND